MPGRIGRLFENESAPPTRVIRPRVGWGQIDLSALWRYRELVWFLTWRDIQLRYRQTLLGVTWAILQPIATMAVFSLFFGRLGRIPSDGLPYPIFAFCALLPWHLFAYALAESSNSLVANQNLVTKIYFPRLVIPLASVLSGVMDFAVSFLVLLVLMFYYGIRLSAASLLVLPLLLLAIVTALGVGLWLSALNVRYRDVRYTIPFLTQFWLFSTPVAYSSSLVPQNWRPLLGLNPMAGVVEGFRWALLSAGEPPRTLMVSVPVAILLFYTGLRYFDRMERSFADIV
ncbi:MAG: ABC transporter permease [Armatimonadetes bacterium]|nr:ABC transporter permease [Armatimonadota bacterium]